MPYELYHHGILGQKWGIRRTPEQLGHKMVSSRKVEKLAKKDAQEYARAKMYYGEGAGNRRKLIKNTVAERSKNAHYKEAFDRYLSEQDMADHANKAKAERKVKDVKNGTGKIGRGIINILKGNWQYAAGSAIVTYGILHYTGLDTKIADWGKATLGDVSLYLKRVFNGGQITMDDFLGM